MRQPHRAIGFSHRAPTWRFQNVDTGSLQVQPAVLAIPARRCSIDIERHEEARGVGAKGIREMNLASVA